jgi:hypothetical protein
MRRSQVVTVDAMRPSLVHDADLLDPATRHAAQLAPPVMDARGSSAPSTPDAPVQARVCASLEEMLPALVRRVAWSGDGRRGSIRLELGAGALAGGTLLVHADEGRVKVELDAPAGVDARAWRERITARLEERRIGVDEVVVR